MITIWNRAFDAPRLERALGLRLPYAVTHDAMNAFHVAFNAFKRKLGFATSLLPRSARLPMWKHTSHDNEARYSAFDAIALWRNAADVDDELARTGAAGVYRDLNLRIDPALRHMTERGLLVNQAVRDELRVSLASEMQAILAEMNAHVPDEVKSPAVWKTQAGAEKGRVTLIERLRRAGEDVSRLLAAPWFTVPGTKTVVECSVCGAQGVKAVHRTRKFLGGTVEPAESGRLFA